jgi:hypothetical protein
MVINSVTIATNPAPGSPKKEALPVQAFLPPRALARESRIVNQAGMPVR